MSSSFNAEEPKTSFPLIKEELKKQIPRITLLVALSLIGTGVGLVQPLLFKQLLDTAIPAADVRLIGLLLVGMVIVPVLSAASAPPTITSVPTLAKASPNACAATCSTTSCTSASPTWNSSRQESTFIALLAAAAESAMSL